MVSERILQLNRMAARRSVRGQTATRRAVGAGVELRGGKDWTVPY